MATIAIEGNLSSGKSTLIQSLRNLDAGYSIQEEPLSSWQNYPTKNGDEKFNLLQLYYENPTAMGFSFQVAAQVSQAQRVLDATPTMDTVTTIRERSIESAVNVFLPRLVECEHVTPLQEAILMNLTTCLQKIDSPDLFVFLYMDPATCYQRVLDRKRIGEDGIVDLSLLEKINAYHKTWFGSALCAGEGVIVPMGEAKYGAYIDVSGLHKDDVLCRFLEVLAQFKITKVKDMVERVGLESAQQTTKAQSANIDFQSAIEAAMLIAKNDSTVPEVVLDVLRERKKCFIKLGKSLEANLIAKIIWECR